MKRLVDGYGHIERTSGLLEDVGGQISRNRKYNGFSQTELGSMVGLKAAQISQIEKGKNLTCSTISKVFGALGYETSLSLEKRVDPGIKQVMLDDMVIVISEFSRKHGIHEHQAFNYLDTYGGIDYLMNNYSLIRCESVENTIKDLEEICRREGGML